MAHNIGDGEEDIVNDSRVHGAGWNGGYCSVELIDELVVLRVRHGCLDCYAHESDAYGLDLRGSVSSRDRVTAECSLPSEKYPSWPASLRLGVSRGRRRGGAGEKTWRVLLCVLQYRRERARCGGGDYVQRGGLWIATSLLPCSLLYSGRHNYGLYHVNVKLVAWNEDSVAAAQSLTRPLTTADITESPCQHLAVNYSKPLQVYGNDGCCYAWRCEFCIVMGAQRADEPFCRLGSP